MHANLIGTLGQYLEGGMGKIPSIPDESDITINDDFLGNQAKDDALEAKSVMVLLAVAKNEEISRVREHCRVIDF
jgi:hypothetical protein